MTSDPGTDFPQNVIPDLQMESPCLKRSCALSHLEYSVDRPTNQAPPILYEKGIHGHENQETGFSEKLPEIAAEYEYEQRSFIF